MEEPILFYNPVFNDNRGCFAPLSLTPNNLNNNWVQSNISINTKRYTLRGLHFQIGDLEQAKLVKVITGMVYDFVVDIREDSPNYMKLHIFDMNEGNELYVPKGFAHGFFTLKDNTIIQYLVDNTYSPKDEGSIVWTEFPELLKLFKNFDNNFNPDDIIISDKDLYTKNFNKKGAV